jgi:hypothetical protein
MKDSKIEYSRMIREDLLRIIDSRLRANNCDGIIESVDETTFTCSVTVGSATFQDVPLRVLISTQSSFLEIPKVGTECVMTFRDANLGRPQLLEVNECDKILIKVGTSTLNIIDGEFKFNGGTKGIPKADVIKTESEKDKAILDALLQIINGAPIPEPGNGSPSALQIALAGVLASKQSGTWTALENTKILM